MFFCLFVICSFHVSAGSNKEFRVVRDNRSNPNVDEELKHSSAQSSGSNINKVVATVNKLGYVSSVVIYPIVLILAFLSLTCLLLYM